jgi:putative cell wall-binding protein/peptidoglycan/xylan/chitin deacetylase (PgdA/CDA1 family)
MRTDHRLSRGARELVFALLLVLAIGSSLVIIPGAIPAQAGSCSAGWVALTYDDGPVPTRTSAVLNALDAVDAPGTFFTVGYLVRSYPSTVRNAADRGNAIANHTDQHTALTRQSEIQIVRAVTRADAAIRTAGVAAVRLVRPPYGFTNSFVRSVLSDTGFGQILWTVDPQDWRGNSASTIANSVARHAKNGSVILLHDGNANYRNTAAATKAIVNTLRSRGYCFGVLDRHGNIVPAGPPEPEFPGCLEDGQAAPDVDLRIVGGPAAVAESLEEYFGGCVSGGVLRSWGGNRYETAAELADDFFPDGADSVFVVVGDNFPDALSASPAAARVDAPVLLTKTSSVPGATLGALADLDPSQIFVVGGTAVISESVVSKLSAYAPVTRLAGADRYATAAAVSVNEFVSGASTVFVATGLSYFDALVSGSAAVEAGAPLLLTRRDVLPNVTASELVRLAPEKVVIVGGTSAVSGEVEDQIVALLPDTSIERLAGSNKYSTSVAAAEASDLDGPHRIFIATDLAFPDGLAAVAAASGSPLLLVSYDDIHPTVARAITTLFD